MYPTLFHLFKDFFGVEWDFLKPVNSFGLLIAVAFLVAAWHFKKEIIRKEEKGLLHSQKITVFEGEKASVVEILVLFLIGFTIGFKFLYPFYDATVLNDFQHYITSTKGSLTGGISVGLLLAGINYYKSEKNKLPEPIKVEKEVKPHEHIASITFLALIFGFIGAKLFAWLEDPVPIIEFFQDPFSGLTIYGGLITASVACIIYIRKKKLPVWHFLDAVSPALILSYGIGRLGCHISGDGDWGIVNTSPKPNWMNFLPDWLWGYNYPNNVIEEGVRIPDCIYSDFCNQLANPVFPTPIYEFLMSLAIFGILLFIGRKTKIVGVLFFSYLFFNGIERFLIELIRVNDTYTIFGMDVTQAQIISSLFVLFGIAGVIFLIRNQHKTNNNSPITINH